MEGEEEEEDDGRTQEEKEKEAKELLASLFSSNIKDEEEKKEIFDSEEEFSEKLDRVVEWMKESKYIVMFTGAGISTRLVVCFIWSLGSFALSHPPPSVLGSLTIAVA